MEQARTEAKAALRKVLATHGGDTKHPTVAAAIQHLVQLNPTPTPAHSHLLSNDCWPLISAPSFPGGEYQDGKYAYTLGRVAFNMFQPTNLKIVLDRVLQPVLPTGQDSQQTHDIISEFTTADGVQPPLQGTVCILGVCEPKSDTELQVQFKGSSLTPQVGSDLAQWNRVFDQTQVAKQSLKERLTTQFLKVMFGIVSPQAMDRETGKAAFEMTRSPKGTLEILYLDEELRITRGEKGTVLVCERLNCVP